MPRPRQVDITRACGDPCTLNHNPFELYRAQAECYDYLFDAAVKLKQLGVDPAKPLRVTQVRRNGSGMAEIWP